MSQTLPSLDQDWLPYPWQQNQWQHVMQLQEQQRLPHALLVQGEKGIGKTLFVHGLVKKWLCQQQQAFACGQCKSCQLITAQTHPDVMTIALEEKAKQIKVDQIRAVVDFVYKTAQMNGLKMVIIDTAENMNINAANALLKCLEEPAADTILVLLSHAPNRLLPTIRSRCQAIIMDKPPLAMAQQWLTPFINDIDQRQKLLQLANGNPLQALAFWDNQVLELYNDSLDKLLGIRSGQLSLTQVAAELQKGDVALWLDMNQKLLWQLIKAQQLKWDLAEYQLSDFHAMTLHPAFAQRAYKVLEVLQHSLAELQGPSNPNPQLLLETILMHWQVLLRLRVE